MSRNAQQTLFALVESFFADFLPQQRGASLHTVRAYRDTLKLLLHFIAQRRKCEMAKGRRDPYEWSLLRYNHRRRLHKQP